MNPIFYYNFKTNTCKIEMYRLPKFVFHFKGHHKRTDTYQILKSTEIPGYIW